jgi:hypothetical protein
VCSSRFRGFLNLGGSIESPGRGFLIGSYWYGSKPTSVVFSTTDLGRTWKFARVLPSIDGVLTRSGETLLAVSTPASMDSLTLKRLPLIGKVTAPVTVTAHTRGIPLRHYNLGAGYDALTMVDDTHGWLLADELLKTTNGGLYLDRHNSLVAIPQQPRLC